MLPKILKAYEHIIVYAIILMLLVVILLATLDLGRTLVISIIQAPLLLLGVDKLLDIFGMILLILIGVELLETVRAYLVDHIVHVEIVLEVALIAVARKVIIVDLKEYTPLTVLSIAGLIVALAIGYFLQKRIRNESAGTKATVAQSNV